MTRGFAGVIALAVFAARTVEVEPTLAAQAATGAAATAGNVADRSVHVPRVSRPPRLDDFLEDRAREAEAKITDFKQREPHDGSPASRETSAYLSFDEHNLYVVFVCKEDPGTVRARMARREDISEDDRVTLYLDSFHDGQRAYVFATNPYGIQRDGIATEGQSIDYRFDTLWKTQGRLTRDGFIVWMAIPFGSLRFASDSSQPWGIALQRTIPRNNESAYWPYITRRQSGFVRQMAALEGLGTVSGSRNVLLNPYATSIAARQLNSSVPAYATTVDARAGLDAKLPIGSAMALDTTLNPDFSQVESDEPQVIVNQRYEVVYPEKRPFFLENAGYFATPVPLFFSRRIADPEFGVRLTGKAGRWAIGALAADDRADGARVDPGSLDFGNRAFVGVASIQRELGSDSRIGLLATSRDFGATTNQVVSMDARLRLSPTWFFAGQAAHSYDVANGASTQGNVASARLSHAGAHLAYEASYLDLSPGFRSTVGYIRRTDLRRTEHYAGYYWRPDSSRILGFGPGVTVGADWDHAGRLQDRWVNADFGMDFAGPSGVRASRYDAYELYLDHGFRYSRTSSSFYVSLARWLSVDGSYTSGGAINYSPAGDLEPFLGDAREATFGFTLRPAARLNIQEYYDYNTFHTESAIGGASVAQRIFDNHIMRTKIHFQFTRSVSLRGILDYYGLFPDARLISDARYQQFSGDVLLTYLVHPGTALYIGYNDRLENVLLEPGPAPRLLQAMSSLSQTGRQLVIKVSYLFRK